jgi:site-specific recombinase XerD
MGTCISLKPKEVKMMLDSFTGREKVRNKALFSLGISTGLRISELLCLTVGTVLNKNGKIVDSFSLSEKLYKIIRGQESYEAKKREFKEKYTENIRNYLLSRNKKDLLIQFDYLHAQKNRSTKNHTGKVIVNSFCHPYLIEHLKELAVKGYQRPSDHLFVTSTGKLLYRWAYYRIIKNAAEKCSVNGVVGTHSMRKTYSIRLFDLLKNYERDGENYDVMFEMKKALRNSSTDATEHYVRSAGEKLERRIMEIKHVN